jgi:hypothetical protein
VARRIWLCANLMILLLILGCGPKVMVPPEIDLAEYESVGLIDFETDAEGTLGPFLTQKFLQEISLSQKEARIIELGSMDEVLESVQRDKLNAEAIRDIGEKHNLSALIVGNLAVSDVKPKVNISSIISHMSVRAEVEASMIVKLLETSRGATVWTGTAQQKKDVAHVSIFSPDNIMFDAKDPEQAYGELTESLIEEVTKDLRVSYKRK